MEYKGIKRVMQFIRKERNMGEIKVSGGITIWDDAYARRFKEKERRANGDTQIGRLKRIWHLFCGELKRSVCNRGMLISAFLGMILVGLYSYASLGIGKGIKVNEYLLEAAYVPFPKDTFTDYWIIQRPSAFSIYLFFFLPLIACNPYGRGFLVDNGNGYIKQIVTRVDRVAYAYCKYITTFFAGGLAVVFPLILSLAILLLNVPWYTPSPIVATIDSNTLLGEMYFSNTVAYILIYIALFFVFGGLMAIISLMISLKSENYFTILLTPFLVSGTITLFSQRFSEAAYVKKIFDFVPYNFLFPYVSSENTLEALFIMIIIVTGLFFLFRYVIKTRNIYT